MAHDSERRLPTSGLDAAQDRELIRKDLDTMRVLSNTNEFLQRLLPLPAGSEQHLSTLLDALRQEGRYENSQWVGLPSGGQSVPESTMYKPLVELFNAINRLASGSNGGGQNQEDRLNGEWFNSHASAPQSSNPNSKTRKPDIVFTSSASIMEMAASSVEDHDDPQDGEEAVEPSKVENDETESDTANRSVRGEESGKKDRTLWWLHVFSALEVKGKRGDSSLAQLATYVRQIFMEQLDRMFVFALTLGLDQLRVHLFDRSGVVSTYPIDIHKSPMEFLHVIVSFTWLPPQKLGWDSTFRVWDGQKPIPSYRLSLEPLGDCSSAYHLPWVIDGFPPSAASTDASSSGGPSNASTVDPSRGRQPSVAQYVTVRCLNLREASSLWGRATMVFEVILLDDWIKRNTEAQIYVLKQSWQRLPGLDSDTEVSLSNASQRAQESGDWSERLSSLRHDLETQPYEVCILRRAGLDSSRLHEAGYVMSEGEKVSTLGFIRKGLTSESTLSRSKSKKQSASGSNASRTPIIHNSLTDGMAKERPASRSSAVAEKPPQVASRTLTRIVLKLPGLTIKFFDSKSELLKGLLGALNDHEVLYKNGIIHRDVSVNNIILSPSDSFGHLIDFDHSKITVRMTSFASQPKPTRGVPQQDILSLFHEDIVKAAARIHGWDKLPLYLVAVTSNWEPRDKTRGFTLEDIGWTDRSGKADFYPIPSFEQRRVEAGRVTGTLAFMSHQLGPKAKLAHTAIHDVESLWWVLVYIVIILGKPGPLPRKREEVMEAMDSFFYDPAESKNEKADLFSPSGDLEALLAYVDDHFNDIKPLIKRWFEILRLAWSWREGVEFRYPHRVVRKLLEETIASLSDDATTREVSWMDESMQEIKEAISQQKTVHMLATKRTPTGPAQPAPTPFAPALPDPAPPTSVPPAPAVQPPVGSSKSRLRSPPTSPPTRKKSKRN